MVDPERLFGGDPGFCAWAYWMRVFCFHAPGL